MCGIYFTNKNFSKQIVKRKMKQIINRGPDFQGLIKYRNSIIAHNRLSIIDLDERSNQPLTYNNLMITYNGEIYNFIELRDILKRKNYHFKTNSDTEIILAMYQEYGKNCVNFFNGMFSFVILDKTKNELFIARDRVGQKPLYYSIENQKIEIGSELGQFKYGSKYEIYEKSIEAYFKYKYIPEPLTIFKNIYKFPAGSYAYYSLDNFKFEINSYWNLNNEIISVDKKQAESELSSLIKSSVKYRLISDVPVGVFLSGGIDSSIIASFAQKESNQKINTFCVKFEDSKFDESLYANQISDYLGTNHTTIDCSTNQIKKYLINFSSYYDEPFADSSSLPTLLLSEMTKKYVTVALSGDGGDESFLGYNRYDLFMKYKNIFKIPYNSRKKLAGLLEFFGSKRGNIYSSLLKLKNPQEFYLRIIQTMSQDYFNGNLDKNFFSFNNLLFNENHILSNISKFDIKTYLSDDINVKVDRASMSFSLETRSPFLDYRILEFANKLPLSYKYDSSSKKIILKQILAKHIPKTIFDRPKSGFTIPLNNWFRYDLKDWVLDNLNDNNLARIPNININSTKKMIDNHMLGLQNKSNEIWKLMVLTSWLNDN